MFILSLPIAVGALYVRKYFDEESRIQAHEIVENIRREFIDVFKKASWMSEVAKREAIKKIQAIVAHIGHPNELSDDAKLEEYYASLEIEGNDLLLSSMQLRKFRVDNVYRRLNKTDWPENSVSTTLVNALYSYSKNSIREFFTYQF